MGTNFTTTVDGTQVHVGKRSAGWAFTFNAATVMDTQVRTRRQWENWMRMTGATVTGESVGEMTADEFWAMVDNTAGKRSFVTACAADTDDWVNRMTERGDCWTDQAGWDFHRGDWC